MNKIWRGLVVLLLSASVLVVWERSGSEAGKEAGKEAGHETVQVGEAELKAVAVASASYSFDDIAQSYAKNQIESLYKQHIVQGTGDRRFEPEKPVTRAEFMAMTSQLLKVKPVHNDIPAFTDVSPGAWYYGYVEGMSNLAIVKGNGSNRFNPQEPISRQETAAVIVQMLKLQGFSQSAKAYGFTDRSSMDAWALPYINQIANSGLMLGNKGSFRPQDAMTRQEIAVVLDKILNHQESYAAPVSAAKSRIQLGWQYDASTEQFIAQIKNTNINTLVPRYYFLNKDGSISDNTDPALIQWASKNGKKVWALTGNRFDAAATHQMLGNTAKREAAIRQLAGYVHKYGLDGINVDFENVQPGDRNDFTAFIAGLSEKLHLIGAKLSVDVSPDLGTDWTEAFDYSALGKSADYVVLMGYDEHWDGSPTAGSVSSLPWYSKALDKLLASVPPGKTIAGLPVYTRDWELDKNVTSVDMTLTQQGDIARGLPVNKSWDAVLGQYVMDYSPQGIRHRIWAEESRSLSLKYRIAAERGVAGMAYWYIGSETADVWTSLSNMEKYISFRYVR